MSFPKVVYFMWLQGIESAPQLIKDCLETWRVQNPGWEIIVLTQYNLGDHVKLDFLDNPAMTPQALSDIVRLRLLSTKGGVWADSTLCCSRPLDTYIIDITSDFWMYHGRDQGRGPCSWFMLAKPGSYIAQRWCEVSDNFWSKYPSYFEYFWMDRLFANLCLHEPQFLKEWKKVAPWMWADAPYSAHHFYMYNLYGRIDYVKHEVEKIIKTPPCVVKLNKVIRYPGNQNVEALINACRIKKDDDAYPPLEYGLPPPFENANFFDA